MKTNKIKSQNTLKGKKYIFLGICGFLTVLTIFTMIDSISGSAEMENLEEKANAISLQKKELNENLVKLNSTTELETKSTEMGFTLISDIVYITKDSAVAQLQ